jgi:phage terminase large subunit-like protein
MEGVEILAALETYKKTHLLEYYKPYLFQENFHNTLGFKTDKPARQKALMCANQVGKTLCGSREVAMHLTGLYPKWWKGTVFKYPNEWIIASTTNETTRDRCQRDLLGDPELDEALGTGAIPLECIGATTRKIGFQNAYDSVLVKHISGGWSKASFRAYEQGAKKFMGTRLTGGYWADEEPPPEINSQLNRGIIATNGIGILTFTPEEGMTEVVAGFLNDLQIGQSLIRAGWDDAPHMTPERRVEALARFPAHERDMRSRGEPLMGSGRVFDIPEDVIMCDPFEIPDHFARINGIDFGWDHPCATAFIAVDRDKDAVYVYDGYRETRSLIPIHASATRAHGDWIPCAWPHDGLVHDKDSGRIIADIYRDNNVNMWPVQFTNPPPPGIEEGKGGNGVEAGIFHMLDMMQTGRFKIFSTVKPWWEEMRMYHRRDGKIIAKMDDFISAVRVAVMFRRHAHTRIVSQPNIFIPRGITNW